MDKRKGLIIGGAALALLLLLGGGALLIGRGRQATGTADSGEGSSSAVVSDAAKRRENTLRLAQDYFKEGEYQRALDLLDGLLIENGDDQDAKDLRDQIIAERKQAEKKAADAERQSQEALKDTLSDLGQSLKSSETSAAEQERDRQLEAKRQEELRKLEDQRKAAEERQRQEADRLAALDKAEREKAEKLKNLVRQGEEAMDQKDYIGARGFFSEALDIDPSSAPALANTGETFFSGR